MANGEKRLIPEDRMEKRKVSKRRQTGTAKDDIESPPSSPRLAPKSSHLTSSLEAPSQLQTPFSSPPVSRPPSPNPVDAPYFAPLCSSRLSTSNVAIITTVARNHILLNGDFVTQESLHQQNINIISHNSHANIINNSIPPCARCPPEIIYHIFEILRNIHQPSLFSCILVNHQWNAIGTNVLWNSPKFTHMRSLDKFIKTMENAPSYQQQASQSSTTASSLNHPYASYIRTLDLTYLTEHDRNNSSLSSHLLRLLPLIHTESLRTLNLSFVKGITNSYLTKLLSPFFNCIRTLNLAGGSRSDTCLSSIIPHCHQIQHLSLAWNTSLSDASINKIANVCGKRLRTLDLTNCEKVSDRSMSSIAQYCVKLRELRVSYCRGVSEVGVKSVIEGCEELKLLDLVGCLSVDRCFLLKCNDDFHLARRDMKLIWRRVTESSPSWVEDS